MVKLEQFTRTEKAFEEVSRPSHYGTPKITAGVIPHFDLAYSLPSLQFT